VGKEISEEEGKSLLVPSSTLLGCEISVTLVMTTPIVTLTSGGLVSFRCY
jgi:hypothetical protein